MGRGLRGEERVALDSYAATIRQHLEAKRPLEAARVALRALQKNSQDADLNLMLAVALGDAGEWESVRPYLEKAIQLAPLRADFWMTWGRFLMQVRDPDAESALREALRLRPHYPAATFELIGLLLSEQRWSEAKSLAERALESDPSQARAWVLMGHLLREGGDAEAAQEHYRRAVEIVPHELAIMSNRAFNSNYVDSVSPSESARFHQEFGSMMHRFVSPQAVSVKDRRPDRRLKVAYLSQDFRDHSCAYFLQRLIAQHDRQNVEVFVLHDSRIKTAKTEQFERDADRFLCTGGLQDSLFIERLRRERIDLLVDLSIHTSNDRWEVLAAKPVPIQVNYLGYPHSSGLKTMDARIVDRNTDPDGVAEAEYSERLIRLDPPFLAYSPPEALPDIADRAGRFTFGSLNALAKIQPRVVALWSRILKACPGARLLVKTRFLQDAAVQRALLSRFEAEGVAADQLELRGFDSAQSSHFDIFSEIDLCLDPFPYNGTTTTCDALWMGVPTLTLVGQRHAGRVGLTLNSAVGLEAWCAESEEEYLERAVRAFENPSLVRDGRMALRARAEASPLADGARLARQLESAYRQLWLEFLDRTG